MFRKAVCEQLPLVFGVGLMHFKGTPKALHFSTEFTEMLALAQSNSLTRP